MLARVLPRSGRLRRFRGLGARALLLLFLACLVAFGCSDSSLVPPDDVFWVKDPPPPNTPSPPASCPSFNAATLPGDLASPSKTPALGVTPGAFSVSSTGEARYEIPLVVPPGRALMQPELALSYDSGSTSDERIVGVGFDVRGFSSIGRCPRSMAQHGEIRNVRDNEKDAFCWDGRPLVPVDPSSARPTEFRAFPDVFAKIVADYGQGSGWDEKRGPRSFTVFTKDGLIHTYGEGSGWVFSKNDVVRSWLLTGTTDRSKNWIGYSYINDKDPAEGYTVETAPWRIEYTGHPVRSPTLAVQFHYAKRESLATRTLFTRGMALKRSLVLDRIEMQEGWTFELVREYRFKYSTAPATKRLLLTSVEECTPGTVCKPPTLFTWHHGAGPQFVETATPLKAPNSKLTTIMPMDVTGDGIEDVVLPDADAPAGSEQPITYWHVAKNRTAEVTPGLFDAAKLAFTQPHGQAALPFRPDRGTAVDYNGDGRFDVFLHAIHGQYATWRVLLAQPDLTFAMHDTGILRPYAAAEAPPLGLATATASAHLADISRDGMSDLIQCTWSGIQHVWSVHFWSPATKGFDAQAVGIDELASYPCNVELYPVDIDADTVLDLLVPEATITSNGPIFGTKLDALRFDVGSGSWTRTETGLPLITQGDRRLFLDANGDSLIDVLEVDSGSDYLHVHFNTGDGVFKAFKALSQPPVLAHAFAELATVIDSNGDGRQDVLLPIPQPGFVPKWMILQATGVIGDDAFTLVDPGLPFDATVLTEGVEATDPHGPRVTDFDGDGDQDVILNVSGEYRVYMNTLKNEDLLASVSDGLRAHDPGEAGFLPNVQIQYENLVDRAAATDGATGIQPEARPYLPRANAADDACDYPIRCAIGPRRVVSGYSIYSGTEEPREFEVAYRNGRYHRLGRGFLGYEERIIRDKATGAGTAEIFDLTTYDVDLKAFPFAGQVAHEYRWNPTITRQGAVHVVGLELRYTHIQRIAVPTLGGRTYFTLPAIQRQRREQAVMHDPDPLAIEEHVHVLASGGANKLSDAWRILGAHDAFGNVSKEVAFTEGIDGEITFERAFENDEAKWLIGLLKKQTECSSAGALSQCRIGERTYDADGRLFSESIQSADGDPETKLTVELFRDDFGNVIKATASDGFGQTRSSCTTYEPEGVYPFAHRNPAGHLYLMKYDPRHGVAKALVDPNGLATRWAHDGFGRVNKEERPDGTWTAYKWTRDKDGGLNEDEYALKVTTTTPGIEKDTVQFDPLGRAIRWWTEGVHAGGQNAPRIAQEITFDALGEHVASRSQPHPDLKLPLPAPRDRYVYDGMGRVIQHTTPWDAVTTYRYIGRTVEITGPDNAVTLIENDPLGRPISTTDPEKGKTLYSYGPFGWLQTVTDPGGAVTTMKRDPFGRVRKHIDPDRGVTSRHYNGFGEPTSVIDQALRKVVFTHDPLGRTVAREDSDGLTTWTYDTAPMGVGALASVTAPDGNKVTYTFDAFGRPKTTTRIVGGDVFTSEVGYDVEGRVSTLTYPQGDGVAPFAIKNDYDPYGHLLAVKDAQTSEPYWTLLATDNVGRTQIEEFGSGAAKTIREYWDEKDRVRSILTKAGGAIVQDLSYSYDKRLNLTRRTDHRQGKSEDFQYDLLDRLTLSYFQGYGRPATYEYEANGNIKSKPGVGLYEYDPKRPHAVTNAGGMLLTYDAVGNLTSRPGMSIDAYTGFDMPKAMTLSHKGLVTIDYDGHQQRVRKSTWDTETVYVDDLYERITDKQTGTVAHRYYVYGRERMVATVTRMKGEADATLFAHVDHLGSIDALTDDTGKVVERRSHDAFGARRNPMWGAIQPPSLTSETSRGFTGHEDDEELGFVNMKGRLYSPQLGRFITPDPIISKPHFGQSWNPYSFVLNSPLNYVDPSGFQEEEPDSKVRGTATWSVDGTELVVVARSDREEDSDARDPAEVGAAAAPIDVSAVGTSTGFSSPVPPTESERPHPMDIAGEVGIGAAGGAFELWWDATKDFVLFWATGGVYTGIKIWSAIYAGYREGGFLGALNVLNPIHAILAPAAKSTQAAADGNYRAAGREGVKALAALAIAVVTIALGPKGPGSGGKNSAGGGASTGGGAGAQSSTGQVSVPRNAHLAGKTHPTTGIPFDKNGHPIFGKHVQYDVTIKPTGSRLQDRKAANQAAGLPETPTGYTWHHHQDYGRMQLVPFELHSATGHTGGFSTWKP